MILEEMVPRFSRHRFVRSVDIQRHLGSDRQNRRPERRRHRVDRGTISYSANLLQVPSSSLDRMSTCHVSPVVCSNVVRKGPSGMDPPRPPRQG